MARVFSIGSSSVRIVAVLFAWLGIAGGAAFAEPAAVEAAFDDAGLAALRVAGYADGASVLADGGFELARVQFASAHRDKNTEDHERQYKLPKERDPYAGEYRTFEDGSTEVVERTFDAERRTLRKTYAWGAIAVTYRAQANRLHLDVSVENRSDRSIEHVALKPLLTLKLPGEVKAGRGHHNIGAPTVIPIEHGEGLAVVTNEGVERPLRLNVEAAEGVVSVVLRSSHPSGGREVYDGEWMSRPIAAGERDRYRISVRFGDAEASRVSLGRPIYERYREAFARTLRWHDRRPIGTLFVTGEPHITEHNPIGYSFGKDAGDLSTEAGMQAFRENMRQYTGRVIDQMHAKGLQGVIVWDIEGATHKTTHYLGSPRFLPVISPAMDRVADEMFKRLSDAGLRTGITLRPLLMWPVDADRNRVDSWTSEDLGPPRQRIRFRNFVKFSEADHPQLRKLGVTVEEAQSPFHRLNNKIAYAKKRWGCSLFYIDTAYFWRPRDRSAENNGWKSLQLSAEVFRKLNQAHPDVLIIPEQQYPQYWAYTAPYHELGYSPWQTRDWIRAIYPQGFVVQQIANKTDVVRENTEAFADIVKRGDSMFVHGWWGGQSKVLRAAYGKAVDDAPFTVGIGADGAMTLNAEAAADIETLIDRLAERVDGRQLVDRRVLVVYAQGAPAKVRKQVYEAVGEAGGILTWSRRD